MNGENTLFENIKNIVVFYDHGIAVTGYRFSIGSNGHIEEKATCTHINAAILNSTCIVYDISQCDAHDIVSIMFKTDNPDHNPLLTIANMIDFLKSMKARLVSFPCYLPIEALTN